MTTRRAVWLEYGRQLTESSWSIARLASTHAVERRSLARVLQVSICLMLALTLGAGTAAAQDAAANPVCADESDTLANMIEGFVQITTGLGIMGLLVVWQADALMEMFTLGREQKAKLKQHKRGAGRSALTLVVLGPLFTVGGSAMQLPIAQCVDLIPF